MTSHRRRKLWRSSGTLCTGASATTTYRTNGCACNMSDAPARTTPLDFHAFSRGPLHMSANWAL
eukprot:1174026-Pyramimonas_sp.AAC.1